MVGRREDIELVRMRAPKSKNLVGRNKVDKREGEEESGKREAKT